MYCPSCHFTYMEDDMYCRHCGTDLTTPSTSLVTTQTNLPAIQHNPQLPRGVAAGVGAVALGVGLELLRRSLLARLTQSPRAVGHALPAVTGLKGLLFPRNDNPVKLPKGYEVHETIVYMKRVIRRQG